MKMSDTIKYYYISFLKDKAKFYATVIDKDDKKYLKYRIYKFPNDMRYFYVIYFLDYKPTFLEKVKIFLDGRIIYYEDAL